MSLSGAAKKAKARDRKKKGGNFGGSRRSELHSAGGRQAQPPHAPKPLASRMAEPTRRIVTLARVEVGEWGRQPDLHTPHESVTVTAILSDGTMDARQATVKYAKGEREKILEAVIGGTGTEKELAQTRRILERRAQAIIRCRGELERMYGNGVAT